jgi:heptosyltransferase-2
MPRLKQILVVGPAWVGDMVMAQSLFITLKQHDDNVAIDVLAPGWSLPLLERMPEVRSAIEQPVGHGKLALKARYRTGKALQNAHYDQVIVLPRSFKSALAPWFARIPCRTGYKGEMRYGLINDMRPLDMSVLRQTVQRYVALGLARDAALPPPIPQPQLRVDKDNQQATLERLKLSVERPVIGFMAGAEYGPAKRWPATYFAGVADYLVRQGNQVWLLGSEKDRPVANQIQQDARHELTNLCGETQLQDVVDLMALMPQVITNDSGLMHVAAAVGCEVIAIYGSSTPEYTPPLTQRAKILYQGLPCSPCFERECPLGHTQCLTLITVEKVIEAIQDSAKGQPTVH